MTKARITLVISNLFHARSFFSGNLYENLSKDFDLQIFFPAQVANRYKSRVTRYGVFDLPEAAQELAKLVLDASLIRNIHRSTSFSFRLKRYVLGDYRRFLNFSPTGLVRLAKALLFASPVLYRFIRYRYQRAYLSDIQFNNRIIDFRPNVIMAWSTTIEPTTMLSIELAKLLGCKSICVFDNWDNLTSKSVLIQKPDYVVCFGPQTKRLAIKIHKLDPDQIRDLGSARFDSYIFAKSSNSKSRRNILIAGSSIALEDRKILSEISKFIKINGAKIAERKLSFVYRPHPAPQGLSVDLDAWEYPEIAIDESSKLSSKKEDSWQSQIELSTILNSCKFVIAAPTTLLIEALICGNRVLVPALKVFKVKTSIRKMLKHLEHLKNLERTKGVFVSYKVSDFHANLSHLCFGDDDLNFVPNVEELVITKPGTFSLRLVDFVKEVLTQDVQRKKD